MRNIKRVILTHTHIDHVQAVSEVRKVSGAKIYSHWAEAGFLKADPVYHGPPTHQKIGEMLNRYGIRIEDVQKKFGDFHVDPIVVDYQVSDDDMVGKLKVFHTPGHTPGHISLFSEEDRTVIGGDFLFKSVLGVDGLYVPPSDVSIDPIVAALSARRISQLKFDKLLLGHQDAPLLEDGPRAVEKAAEAGLK